MRGHHDETPGWTTVGPGAVMPAHGFGHEAWGTGHDGAAVVPVMRPMGQPLPRVKPPTLRGTAWRTGKRHRRQLAPWLAAPVLPLAVLIGRAEHAQVVALLAAAVLGFIVIRKTWPRIYPAACAVLGAGWAALASQYGLVHNPALRIFIGGWFILGVLPWWNRYRIRHHHPKPEGEPPAPLTPDELLTRLRERVCGQGQQLSGAVVTEEAPIKGGRKFLFSLVPGKQDFEHVRACNPGHRVGRRAAPRPGRSRACPG